PSCSLYSKHYTAPGRPAGLRRAVQGARAVLDQASRWVGSIGAVKLVENSEGPAGRQLVHRAGIGRPGLRRAVQVARAVSDQTSRWVGSIGAVKLVESSEAPAVRQLVHRAAGRPAGLRRAVQGARAVSD